MKRHTLVLVILLSAIALPGIWAQDAVLSSGGDATATLGSVSFSVGQVAYTSQSSQSGVVSAGVQQPIELFTVGNTEPFADMTIGIYPNPTKDKLILEISDDYPEDGQQSYLLYDLYGKLLLQERIVSKSVIVPLDRYTDGMYLLKVSHNDRIFKTFKVIKTN
jgi:hypothetical protein